ncbi:TetR/AcrR family transcriptional regulator [Streptococcus macacae]|uniref:Transcriptional regulator, TetR family n=1 Tax=Streptococcus macacae NCTC 11558 TaxID=764298 RepID=G5JX30_9STRE|nr:TetR/AcrR family transcriptional regulator [Streptococcus macacae]EHJ52485.1 transcriptional regulator, TetR family [Streptococcus macacae NCTC 11558]SUN79733.1 transcriptional regulator [Streptococcus macacae NCTC 11558]
MKNTKKEKTKKALEEAMANLLKEESFNTITITQLTHAAHLSRSSFYTHYKDKYEMIDKYQQSLFNKLEYIFDKNSTKQDKTILEIFQFLNREPLFAALLSENGTKEIQDFLKNKFKILIKHNLQIGDSISFKHKKLSHVETEYGIMYIINALFGVCQMWIARGKIESPEQMTSFIIKMMH